MEEKKIVPYNALKWKEATVIWNEANNLIKKGKLAKNLAAGLIMNNYGEEYER